MSGVIVPVSTYAIKEHLYHSYQALHRHLDELRANEASRSSLAALQEHLIDEVRWLQAIAPHVDGAWFSGRDGRRAFLKRYSTAVVTLARALKEAVEAEPASEESAWRRAGAAITRLFALEDEARQL